MPPSVCRGCAKLLPASDAGVDMFADAAPGLEKAGTVRTGIELITGLAVSESDGLPGRLCAECNRRLEEFLAFRNQLLNSLRVFRSGRGSEESLPGLAAAQRSPGDGPAPRLEEGDIELEISDRESESQSTPATGHGRTECSQELKKINVIEEDPESDIDVCSGEDYDVLELDVQSRKDEIYEIDSSGESDVQVCDY